MSKTYRLSEAVCEQLRSEGIETDLLDLSLITSDPMRHIHPCNGCVSTAMPLKLPTAAADIPNPRPK